MKHIPPEIVALSAARIVVIIGLLLFSGGCAENKEPAQSIKKTTIQWKDGLPAYIVYERRRIIRQYSGDICVTGYEDLEYSCPNNSDYCTLIFRCK